MDRRETLRTMVGGVGFLTLGRHVHALAREAPLRILSARQEAIVVAASERIIPATETPGAAAAQVSVFVDTILAEWYTPEQRQRLLAGLAELDAQQFLDRTPTEQADILDRFDAEATPDHWFGMLKYLTVWGYYTSAVAQKQDLGLWPLPWRYDGNAPYPH
jgi:gluconate 2-dehydrogenase gamma chain